MKILIIFTGLLLFFIIGNLSWAHPPSNVELDFDSTGTVLTVKSVHPVNNPDRHYIIITVTKLNGTEIIKQTLDKQDSKESTEVFYKLNNLKPGDKIEVTAQCSISGKLKTTLVVPSEE